MKEPPEVQPVLAYIGLGSNLENPVRQVLDALRELDGIQATRCVRHSSLYRTRPMGDGNQPDYINAVALLETGLDPHRLLRALQTIEQQHRRTREERWGPRTLDLDILLYGDEVIRENDLQVPHPGMHERPFVLYPLMEIAPEVRIPEKGMVKDLARLLAGTGEVIERINELS